MAIPPKPKRRFLRFTLSTLLLLMLVVCVALGWKVERARKQREAVIWIQKLGGSVGYDYERDNNGQPIRNAEPPGPKWLMKQLGIDFFDDVVHVDLSKAPVSDVTPLSGLTNLKTLRLSNSHVKDVTALSGLTRLEELSLEGIPLGEKAMESLKKALPQCVIESGHTTQ